MERWYPLTALAAFVESSPTSAELAAAVVKGASSLQELRLCRDILWAAIQIKCHDGRRAWLTKEHADALYRYAVEDADLLLSSLATVNLELDRLGGDEWVDVTPLVKDLFPGSSDSE